MIYIYMTAPSENISLDAPLLLGIYRAVDCSSAQGFKFCSVFIHVSLFIFCMAPCIITPFEIEILPSSVQGPADPFIYSVIKFRKTQNF